METLGQRIKYERIAKNLTQPELAKALEVSNCAISLWENDINEPKATYIIRMALFFDCTSDYLLGIERDRNKKELS